jgi:hypothetical protein
VDTHKPSWFVPLSSVYYLNCALSSEQAQRVAPALWSLVREERNPLTLLNGFWSMAPGLHDGIIEHATHCHVVIAEPVLNLTDVSLRPLGDSLHRLEVAPPRDSSEKIRVQHR